MQVLKGSFVAIVTPMFEDGNIDFQSLKSLVNWHIKAKTKGIVFVGFVVVLFPARLSIVLYCSTYEHTVLLYSGNPAICYSHVYSTAYQAYRPRAITIIYHFTSIIKKC